MSRPARRMVLTALTVLAMTAAAGCGSGGGEDGDAPSGLLTKADLPFEVGTTDTLKDPDILTQLGSAPCLGIEQDALYEAKWKVEPVKQFYAENKDWEVQSAVFTAPKGGDRDGLTLVEQRNRICMQKDPSVDVSVLDLGAKRYGFLIKTDAGAFNAARGYAEVSDGRLAQVSIREMPRDDNDAAGALQKMLDKLT